MDPGRFIEQLFPAVVRLLNAVMGATPPAYICGCRKPVLPGQMLCGARSVCFGVGRAGLGRAGGGMIFGLWA